MSTPAPNDEMPMAAEAYVSGVVRGIRLDNEAQAALLGMTVADFESADDLVIVKKLLSAGFHAGSAWERARLEPILARVREEARRDVYLAEVTFWLGEHRAYVESGMMWEGELAMKNARRYGELAEAQAARSEDGPEPAPESASQSAREGEE